MTVSRVWALVGGLAVVGGVLGGAVAWKRAHPGQPLPVAALDPIIEKVTPAPSPSAAPPPAPPVASQAPAVADKPVLADRGPEPPSAPNPAMAPASASAPPTFDVVRVEPTGEAVIAGEAKPKSTVSLVASGKVVAEGKADDNGQFVLTPPPLKPGAYDLSLRQKEDGKAPEDSRQAVAVAVQPPGQGAPVVALAEPGKPTQVLSAPAVPPPAVTAGAKPDATPKPAQPLAIRTAELENGSGFFATGTAPPGSRLRIYLNESHVADVTAGPDGQWTLRIGKGLTGGHYTVRADSIGPGDKVIARVEVPFDVPVAVAQAAKPAAAPPVVSAPVAAPEPPTAPNPVTADETSAAPPTQSAPRLAESKAPAVKAPDVKAPEPRALASAVPEPKPAESKPADARPTDAKPVEAKAPEAKAPETKPSDAKAAEAAPPPGANAVIEAIETALVVRGDNLWNISRARLGAGPRYTQIYTANAAQIRNPDLIYPGQVFVVPH